jgi:hypothetical protein
MFRIAAFTLLAGLALPNTTTAAPKFQWIITEGAGKTQLEGLDRISGDDSVDALSRVGCRPAGKIELGIGANISVGKGDEKAVTLTAVSGETILKVDGVSKKSRNFNMTPTYELVKETSWDDPIIQLMIKVKSVTFRGASVQQFTVPAIGFRAQLEKLKKICDKAA